MYLSQNITNNHITYITFQFNIYIILIRNVRIINCVHWYLCTYYDL